MKKKLITKLKFKKTLVSTLNADNIKGGTVNSKIICDSEIFCLTENYTNCNGMQCAA